MDKSVHHTCSNHVHASNKHATLVCYMSRLLSIRATIVRTPRNEHCCCNEMHNTYASLKLLLQDMRHGGMNLNAAFSSLVQQSTPLVRGLGDLPPNCCWTPAGLKFFSERAFNLTAPPPPNPSPTLHTGSRFSLPSPFVSAAQGSRASSRRSRPSTRSCSAHWPTLRARGRRVCLKWRR